MKKRTVTVGRLLGNSKLWLFAIAFGIAAVQVILTWKLTRDSDRLSLTVLSWCALFSLLWKKRNTLKVESDIFSTLFGIFLIATSLIKSTSLFWFESSFIKIAVLFFALGLALIASGFNGLKQYLQEFIIVLLLVIPEELLLQQLENLINTSLLAAKFSTFMLWYLGFTVSRQGVNVILPNGAIEIYAGCSGLNAMLLLLRLSLLFVLVFPTELYKKILLPTAGVLLAFLINGIRVALMAVLVASSNQQAFEYWHGSEGNQIFSTISILVFGILCQLFLHENKLEHPENMEF
ncbi:cyanoexosortase A [Funiculus sociatus GB2-A5]|uniref:Cyanoexosortase A n=1 Tax=Funiculus sociatus GB2-A5 TaxID=2933946 RepID=A0ABV0JS62_9CYAN|nr:MULTISPECIES: cyanoexosortase A [unclassified Trichocoleus]MBD1908079.1 cyanoexosortase A [Trichocoleus sp. FACHB-832]MBD2061336.1 cyanoexosortase A [Trichocoleus sp. FACHB-6]